MKTQMTPTLPALAVGRTLRLARWNAVLLTRNRLALMYGLVLPLLPLALLLAGDRGDLGTGGAAVVTTLTMALLFPVYYNILSQFVTRRDELVLKRLRTGEARDSELLTAMALPGAVIVLAVTAIAVPITIALGRPAPLNPFVYVATVLVCIVLFTAFAFWTAAWTRNAEAAQLTSAPVIVLAVLGQMSPTFPESVQRWVDLTPGAAMTELVRSGWFGFDGDEPVRSLDFAATWGAAAQPLVVLLAWTVVAASLARRSLQWEPRV